MKTRLTAFMAVTLVLALLTVSPGLAAPNKVGGGVHVVQWGENLATIAYRYGVPVEVLIQANGLSDPNLIYIGQQLVIPSDGNVAGPAGPGAMQLGPGGMQAGPGAMQLGPGAMQLGPGGMQAGPGGMQTGPAPQSYIVRYGDTLTAIAMRYGTSIDALMQANGLYDGTILIGQPLMIPGGNALAQAGPPLPQAGGPLPNQGEPWPNQGGPLPMQGRPGPMPMMTYGVKSGDTLSALAYRYGTTVSDLMQINNLYNPWIFTGQQLAIPGGMAVGPQQQPAGTFYTVRRGDTLAGVALRYGTTVPNILQANNLSQMQFIQPGQELVIPGTMTPPEAVRVPLAPRAMGAQGTGPTIQNVPTGPQGKAPLTLSGQKTGKTPFTVPVAPPVASGPGPRLNTGPLLAPLVPGQGGPLVAGPLPGYGPPGVPVGSMGAVLLGDDPAAAAANVGAPVQTTKWIGALVSQTFPENSRYPSVLRVRAGGGPGMQVTLINKAANWSTTGFTGDKPEYGEGTVEFAPLNSGRYIVSLDGQGGSMNVNIKPNSLTYVEFAQVPANNGPYDGPYSP